MAATATAEVLDGAQGRPEGLEAWYRNYHRYYDPAVGRYTQVDPLGSSPGLAMAAARGGEHVGVYEYAMNDPISKADSDGNFPPYACVAQAASLYYSTGVNSVSPRSDPLRHCVASCYLATTCGSTIASWIGLYKEFPIDLLRKWFPNTPAGPSSGPDAMDLKHDQIGIGCAAGGGGWLNSLLSKKKCPPQNCVECCLSSIPPDEFYHS